MKVCPNCKMQLDDDSVFCTGCGQKIEGETAAQVTTFCQKCGTPLSSDTQFCTQCGTPVGKIPKPSPPKAAPMPQSHSISMPQAFPGGAGSDSQKVIIAALVVLLVGGGGWYFYNERKGDSSKSSASIVTNTQQAKPQSGHGMATNPSSSANDQAQNKLKAAEKELKQYGVNRPVHATSYGHSSDGFMILDNNEGVLVLVDRNNRQVAEVTPRNMNLNKFRQSRNESYQNPIIVEFKIPNAVRDNDAEFGSWVNISRLGNHRFTRGNRKFTCGNRS